MSDLYVSSFWKYRRSDSVEDTWCASTCSRTVFKWDTVSHFSYCDSNRTAGLNGASLSDSFSPWQSSSMAKLLDLVSTLIFYFSYQMFDHMKKSNLNTIKMFNRLFYILWCYYWRSDLRIFEQWPYFEINVRASPNDYIDKNHFEINHIYSFCVQVVETAWK